MKQAKKKSMDKGMTIHAAWGGSNGNEDLMLVEHDGDYNPNGGPVEIHCKLLCMGVAHFELNREVVMENLVQHVDSNGVHSCNQ